MKKEKEKMYIVRTYIMAKNAKQALSRAKKVDAHECWVDEEWSRKNKDNLADSIGFVIDK